MAYYGNERPVQSQGACTHVMDPVTQSCKLCGLTKEEQQRGAWFGPSTWRPGSLTGP
jgi:hypothetical protein